MTTASGMPYVNGVPPAIITMAGCQQAWARRFMPWLLATYDSWKLDNGDDEADERERREQERADEAERAELRTEREWDER